MRLAYFSSNGTLSPRKNNELKELEQKKAALVSERLKQYSVHEKLRSQTACSQNSYIKPRSLLNFNLDYETFDRFQQIKRQK